MAAESEFDVLADGEMREQRVVLEDRADVALVRFQMLDGCVIEADFAGGRVLEAGDHSESCGLAAAGRSEEREELAVVERERDGVDGEVAGEAFRDAAKFEDGGHGEREW